GGDHGPYRQTERLSIYREYTEKLLAAGQAYHCYCSEEELEAERQALLARGEMPRYLGKCRDLCAEDRHKYIAAGRKPVVRFRVPENKDIVVNDLVRDKVVFESNGIGDFVIVKSDGIPTYNFAVVLDDALMGITHVIRGEEHLSNTPRQILIYQALGFKEPQFAHVSLILGKDRSKMSKRHGATAIEQYQGKGYLPEALINFLVLLGWSPVGEEEIFSLDELVRQFSLERVARNPAVFDLDKLNWINGFYIRQKSVERITDMALPYLQDAGFITGDITPERRQWLELVVESVREHLSFVAEITDYVGIYFNDDIEFENEEAREVLRGEQIPTVMDAFRDKVREMPAIDADAVKTMLKTLTKELKLGGKLVYMPVRVALTGQTHGPE
ncbi:glutamate--tRNA ligase, partial [bacterium]